jgi:hypothetical protein
VPLTPIGITPAALPDATLMTAGTETPPEALEGEAESCAAAEELAPPARPATLRDEPPLRPESRVMAPADDMAEGPLALVEDPLCWLVLDAAPGAA